MKKYSHSLVLACALVFGLVSATKAATITVNSANDEIAVNSECTLREAIINTNNNANTHADCANSSGDSYGTDAISIPAGTYCLSLRNSSADDGSGGGTISSGTDEDATLTGDLDITGNLTLTGSGVDETLIDGGSASGTTCSSTVLDRILEIGSSLNVTISDLTLRGGHLASSGNTLGGGIYVRGSAITLTNSAVSGNAISGYGYGGGIYGTTVSLTNSTVADNTISSGSTGSNSGGGIYGTTVSLTNSAVTNNTISSSNSYANGGGIYGVTVSLTNSTIAGNTVTNPTEAVGGGIYVSDSSGSTATIVNSTITENQVTSDGSSYGGGISSGGTVSLKSTILSGNTATDGGPDCYASSGAGFISYDYNFIAADSLNCTFVVSGSNDLTTYSHSDLLLSSLSDNGGSTQTMALASTSPAVDAGSCEPIDTDDDDLTTDQREFLRPYDGDGNSTASCDIGAYEYQLVTYYADADGDGYGYGDAAVSTTSLESAPSGYVSNATDCNDALVAIYPGATESCNDVDDDCDGETDENDAADALIWYADADGDTYGDAGVMQTACSQPTGYVSDSSDCDDDRADIHSGIPEFCDNTDNNCDGQIDEGLAITYYYDGDHDGYGTSDTTQSTCHPNAGANYITASGDCDDSNNSIYPGATEACDGIDNDCDGQEGTTWYYDDDGDGYGNAENSELSCTQSANFVADNTDCDDQVSTIYPGATEECNGADDDCDGQEDDGVGQLYYPDDDGDGYGEDTGGSASCEATPPEGEVTNDDDCDDDNANRNPGNTEICGDGVDQDCNESDLACASDSNDDDDGDGILDTADNCSLDTNTDQIDTDSDGAGNVCDADDDADGVADNNDAFSLDATESIDNDGDGIGDNTDEDDDGDSISDVNDSDADGDSIDDASDNCPAIANAFQTDADGDGTGDDCESENDEDGDADVDSDSITVDSTTPVVEGTGTVGDDDGVDSDGNAGTGGGGCSLNAKAGAMPSFSLLLFFLPVFLVGMLLTRKRTKMMNCKL